MAYKRTSPMPIAEGGTNATVMTNTDGIVYYDGTALVTTAVGAATQVLTSNGAGLAPTFQAAGGGGGGFSWSVITASQSAVAGNGYIANSAGTLVLTLPATSAIGDLIEVTGINNATGWSIAQNAGQQIHFGAADTTIGVTGSLSSTLTRDSVRIVCVVAGASAEWNVLSSVGNLNVV